MRISDWSSDVCSSDLAIIIMIGGFPIERDVEAEDVGKDMVQPHPRRGAAEQMEIGREQPPRRARVGRRWTAAVGHAERVERDALTIEHAIEIMVGRQQQRSEEHTYELQSLMRISYAVFCLKNKN